MNIDVDVMFRLLKCIFVQGLEQFVTGYAIFP